MNKILIYIFLILLYIALPRNFYTSKEVYISDPSVFSNYFDGNNLTVVLVEEFTKGVFFKTYFQRYRIFYGPGRSQEVVARTSGNFFRSNRDNIGMSIYRKTSSGISTLPMPGGGIFVGNERYGKWVFDNSGIKVWKFYLPYKEMPQRLGWGDYRPDYEFYKQYVIHNDAGKVYRGSYNEFGTNGNVTKKGFKEFFDRNIDKFSFKNFLKKYLSLKFGIKNKGHDKV